MGILKGGCGGLKHTPGPWRIVDECEGPGGYLVSETIDDISIAEVFKHNSQSEEEDKANAILIAEAPDMLRLLKGTLCYLRASGNRAKGLQRDISTLLEKIGEDDVD